MLARYNRAGTVVFARAKAKLANDPERIQIRESAEVVRHPIRVYILVGYRHGSRQYQFARYAGAKKDSRMRTLVAIPVYNERGYVRSVLDRVLQQKRDAAARGQELDVLIVDDGSTDGAPEIASEYPVNLCRRVENMGYGRSMRDAFDWSIRHGYDWLITMDCDEQHEPTSIPDFLSAQQAADARGSTRGGKRGGTRGGTSANRARNEHARSDQVPGHASGADIISGTRYLRASTGLDRPPADRRQINLP